MQILQSWLLILVYYAVAGFALAHFWTTESLMPVEPLAFLALFLVTQNLKIQLQLRFQSLSFTFSDIALVLALFYLPLFWVLAVKLLAVVIWQGSRLLRHEVPVFKPAVNLAASSVGTSAGCVTVALLGLGGADEPRTWLVLVTAVVIATVCTWIPFVTIIPIAQGWALTKPVVGRLPVGILVSLIGGSVGIICLALIDTNVWAIVPIALVAGIFILLARNYARIRKARAVLDDLNSFTQVASGAVRSNRLLDAVLHKLREIMQSEYAVLWIPREGRYPQVRLVSSADGVALSDTDPIHPELEERVVRQDQAMDVGAYAGTFEERLWLRESGLDGAIIVPLRSGPETYGCLAVANKIGGELARFNSDDRQLMETIAAHVSVAVDNSRLIDQLTYDAYHDPLTGLPNRRRTTDAVAEAIAINVADDVAAVMLFDVDNMHEVNDALGHEAGDRLLNEFAERLRQKAPQSAFIGRVDSDEFIVQLRVPTTRQAGELAQELHDQVAEEPFNHHGVLIDISAAVGVVTHPDFASTAEEMLQRANTAVRQAKENGNHVTVYHTGLESQSLRRVGLAADLRRALDAEALEVYYQPKIDLRTGEVEGAEALLRWSHSTYGFISPEEFISIAAQTGQLGRLTEWVLRQSMRQAAEWSDENGPLPMAVNLSPRTLADLNFPDRVGNVLNEFGISTDRLIFEITEDDMVADGPRLTPVLQRLHEAGVQLAVDDFGTGYSSLSYLRRLPVSEIKIDLRFVQGMNTDPDDRAIVKAIIDLAEHFDMRVVAEGVETAEVMDELRQLGCDSGQGYYFTRPLPAQRFETWLDSHRNSGR
ncbi:putative bifunctional diguanylate cyclase/phosphodiesterase [Haloglycomyces albus]|uniref:putative bifunctional diguanylate cyclase/phosphodiesterase n=1 Tax=Haloglycomyces albus TaxID=526067 RepID=UPI00046CAAAB|nr:sensor domain-containing phosphodiesterase [Haloglycomyces albus]